MSFDVNCLLECQLHTKSSQDQNNEQKQVTMPPTNTNHPSPEKKVRYFPANHSPVTPTVPSLKAGLSFRKHQYGVNPNGLGPPPTPAPQNQDLQWFLTTHPHSRDQPKSAPMVVCKAGPRDVLGFSMEGS